jgi:hypothetical protein
VQATFEPENPSKLGRPARYADVDHHLWLVDPLARVLEVYRLEAGRWVVALTSGGEDTVRAEPFADVELDLARWWPPLG